jgi:hypothetical protein
MRTARHGQRAYAHERPFAGSAGPGCFIPSAQCEKGKAEMWDAIWGFLTSWYFFFICLLLLLALVGVFWYLRKSQSED